MRWFFYYDEADGLWYGEATDENYNVKYNTSGHVAITAVQIAIENGDYNEQD